MRWRAASPPITIFLVGTLAPFLIAATTLGCCR
jgi:hypothetical protein